MTNLELILLGILAEKPQHGYEIENIIEARNIRDWAEIGFSSIYYVLGKLEEKGLVSGQRAESEGKGPGKKVYTPTPAGYQQLQIALLETLSTPHNTYSPFLIGLANLPVVPLPEAIAALKQQLQQLSESQVEMQARQDELNKFTPAHVHAMFDLSNTLFNAHLEWLKGFITQLENKKD